MDEGIYKIDQKSSSNERGYEILARSNKFEIMKFQFIFENDFYFISKDCGIFKFDNSTKKKFKRENCKKPKEISKIDFLFQTSKDIFIVAKKKLYSLIKNDNFKFKLIGGLNDLFGIN